MTFAAKWNATVQALFHFIGGAIILVVCGVAHQK